MKFLRNSDQLEQQKKIQENSKKLEFPNWKRFLQIFSSRISTGYRRKFNGGTAYR